MELRSMTLETDILIIGGGTAGCFSAITIAENASAKVIVADKANIRRSGCLASGVNAINAYINPGETPESYTAYVKRDSGEIIREDLVYSIAKGLNGATRKLESLGLPLLKDEAGNYVSRGKRSIKINGENIKPILAKAVEEKANVTVLNRVNIIDYILKDGKVIGAYGISVEEEILYILYAKAVICSTGGAAGIYRPNNLGFSRHKMWYSPFNTGAGYAMGIRAGAEMTTFEMRFIALRCKDTIAPTGTTAQGVGSEQVNSKGDPYVKKYGRSSTPMRLYATVMENREGRGPCYLKTEGIDKETEEELYKAYLNMAPAQTLRWVERGKGPAAENIEIEGTEPYIVGGHTASGYWVDIRRATTLEGLFAAGDVAGGSPKKYVTGCLVEGEIAARSALEYLQGKSPEALKVEDVDKKRKAVEKFLRNSTSTYTVEEVEEAMQKVMDEYAGGLAVGYVFNAKGLKIAEERIRDLTEIAKGLPARDMHELMLIHEILDRLEICRVLIRHLEARKETRWHCYNQNADYPEKDDEHWKQYINSRVEDGEVKIIYRRLVERDEFYEHSH